MEPFVVTADSSRPWDISRSWDSWVYSTEKIKEGGILPLVEFVCEEGAIKDIRSS